MGCKVESGEAGDLWECECGECTELQNDWCDQWDEEIDA